MEQRGLWKSNLGFLLAAIGSAIGLGNIWRFSYMCHKNGGGTFLIPYIIALICTGIPVMILEFALGHKMRGSAPHSMYNVHPRWEWLGWWPVIFVMFGINLFYTVVIAWCALYMLYSLKSEFPWAAGAETFFNSEFLNKSGGVFEIGGVQLHILIMMLVIWGILAFICMRRVDKGIELASKLFMPVLLVLTAILVFWGLTLDGAGAGIKQYLKPDWSKLGDVQIWREAFGQIFFSLSIGFGIMIAYASYLPKRANLVKNAFITSIANCSYSVFAGFAVFSVLGYMALASGETVDNVVSQGPGLCFVVYPQAISLLPGMNSLFGFLFFLTLVLAGLTSSMSIVEAFTSAVIDKFGWSRAKVVLISCAVGAVGSIMFTTRAGMYWLDIAGHYLDYGLISVGLLECLLIGWYYKIDDLHEHLSSAADSPHPKPWEIFWEWTIMFVVPTVLVFILAWSIYDEFASPYGGYPQQALVLIGLGFLVGTFLVAGLFSVYTRHRRPDVPSA